MKISSPKPHKAVFNRTCPQNSTHLSRKELEKIQGIPYGTTEQKKPYERIWYTALGLGLKAMAVTAPVCPRRTEIGCPSGKRHCHRSQ